MDDNNISYFVVKCLGNNKKRIKDFYKGSLTSDELKSNIKINLKSSKPFTIAFIINTLNSSSHTSKDGHWLGMSIQFKPHQKRLTLRFFDSLGKTIKSYNHYINSFIESIQLNCRSHRVKFDNIDTMNRRIQTLYSKVCGLYAVAFIISTWVNKNTKSVNDMFQGFTIKNGDLKMLLFMEKYYPSKSCHNSSLLNKGLKKSIDFLMINPAPPFCPIRTLGVKNCFKKCRCE